MIPSEIIGIAKRERGKLKRVFLFLFLSVHPPNQMAVNHQLKSLCNCLL